MRIAPQSVAVVGAGPAGLATVRGLRQAGSRAQVTLIGEEGVLPYSRPPLTKEFLRGELPREELPIEAESWYAEQQVMVHLGRPVMEIDPGAGELRLRGGKRVHADVCVLATGADPVVPPIEGSDHPDVLFMRRLPDSERLSGRVVPEGRVTVVGSGFIGCEIAASLTARGARVTLITAERLPQVQRLGQEAGVTIAGWLREAGVELVLDAQVQQIEDGRHVHVAQRRIAADAVVLATGVTPRSELAGASGLTLHEGAISVDSAMSASHSFFRAVGDVSWAENAAAGRHLRVEHWGDALGQGEVAGRSLAGEDSSWSDVPGFWSMIGSRTLKYSAWGDGYERARHEDHGGPFTTWYERGGAAVGVLCHDRDEDYERGRELIAAGAPIP